MPQPEPGELIVARHFGVHTEIPDSQIVSDYRFGLCVVETDVAWLGPVHLDVDAETIPGLDYSVNCKIGGGVDNQPLTLGLTTFPPEFTSPRMRATTIECDPRSVARWSTWYFIPNGQHLTGKESSKTYVGRMSSKVKGMIGAMRAEGAVAEFLLDDVKSQLLDAEKLFKGGKATAADAALAMPILDAATVAVLREDPVAPFYPGSASFTNPKGQLSSHLMALRYAVCSELAHPSSLGSCFIDPTVEGLLPPLP